MPAALNSCSMYFFDMLPQYSRYVESSSNTFWRSSLLTCSVHFLKYRRSCSMVNILYLYAQGFNSFSIFFFFFVQPLWVRYG